MSENLDLISPVTMGSDQITIDVDIEPGSPLLVGYAVTLLFDYSKTLPNGVVLPIQLQIQPTFGTGVGYISKFFRRSVPNRYAFIPQSAGGYLVVLKECGHNLWQGRKLITISGETFSQIQSSR